MIIEIKTPSPGESVTEVEIGKWLVGDDSVVEKGQDIAEIESDKATLTLVAAETGGISIKVAEGETVAVGDVVCTINTDKVGVPAYADTGKKKEQPATGTVRMESLPHNLDHETDRPLVIPGKKDRAQSIPAQENKQSAEREPKVRITPVAEKMMTEKGLSMDDILNGLKRISKQDVAMVEALRKNNGDLEDTVPTVYGEADHNAVRTEKREKMSMLRRKLSARLVAVRNETAMLTTFNEVDMARILDIRSRYQESFVAKHGVKLGFMSLFTKAAAMALRHFPIINSMIDGDEVVTPGYVDIGVAVNTDKGLMVPVVRNANLKSVPAIEAEIRKLAVKARDKKITVEELSGGTFTITNGGVFGSLFSTPILNPPQSAILGMHNVTDRPVAIDGRVVIRPMMYVALSYDHRLIDGRDAVSFLGMVKEFIEKPELLLTSGSTPEEQLLEL